MTKIVEKQGSLFRLSDAAYRRLLELVIAEQEYDLWELGRCIGCIHASMGSFQRDDAEFELARQDINASAIVQPNASNRRERPAAGRSGGAALSASKRFRQMKPRRAAFSFGPAMSRSTV